MATFKLSVNPARSTKWGYSILFDFKEHFPPRTVEAKNTGDALAALDVYAKEAEATGKSLCVTIMLARGQRSPNGFKKAKTNRFVNLQPEEAGTPYAEPTT